MTCSRCDEFRRNGDRFCPYCGDEFSNEIPVLPPEVSAKKEEQRAKLSEIFFALGLIISVLLTALLALELFTAVSKMGFVIDGISSNAFSYPIIIITPYIVELFRLSGTPLTFYYVLLVIAVVVSVALVYVKSFRPYASIGEDKGERARSSVLYEMTVLFAAMMAIELVYVLLVGAKTSPIDKTEVWKNMFSLLSASVWEEVVTRFLIIGVPIAVIYMIKNRSAKHIKMIVGGFNNFNVIVVTLIFLSAIVFALAHVTSGSWGEWKIFPTFMFGLIAGYLFVKYGLHAAIAMHFLNDYMLSETWLIGSSLEPFTIILLVVVCVLSIPFIYVYGKRIAAFFKSGMDDF